jgi:hypothetical protein
VSGIRLIALDVDGTLLTSRHAMGGATVAEIARVRALGVVVLLASSRATPAMTAVAAAAGLGPGDPFVACQGAVTAVLRPPGSPEGPVRFRQRRSIPPVTAQAVAALVDDAGLAGNWFTGMHWYVSRVDAAVRREAGIVGVEPTVADLAALTEPPDKLLVMAADAERLESVAAALPDTVTGQVSNPTYLEITTVGVDKRTAVQRVARDLGLAPAQVMAMGDGPNDVGMLTWAGVAVAPSNARPDVLAVADTVVGSNDEEAVAQALRLYVA